MQLHFQRDEGQKPITGSLPGQNLHRPRLSPELFMEPLNEIGCAERYTLLDRETKKGRAHFQKLFQGSDHRRNDILPFLKAPPESLHRRLFRNGIEDGFDGHCLIRLDFSGHPGQNVMGHMDQAPLGCGLREFFPEYCLKACRPIHDDQCDLLTVETPRCDIRKSSVNKYKLRVYMENTYKNSRSSKRTYVRFIYSSNNHFYCISHLL